MGIFLVLSCNPWTQSASNNKMASKQITGRGRLVPTRLTGIAYQVRYGIHIVEDAVQQGRGAPANAMDQVFSAFPQCWASS